jgi:hypothetical protein
MPEALASMSSRLSVDDVLEVVEEVVMVVEVEVVDVDVVEVVEIVLDVVDDRVEVKGVDVVVLVVEDVVWEVVGEVAFEVVELTVVSPLPSQPEMTKTVAKSNVTINPNIFLFIYPLPENPFCKE